MILHIDSDPPNPSYQGRLNVAPQLNWTEDDLSFASVRQYLVDTQPTVLRIAGIPNARAIAAVKTVEWLAGTKAPKTAGQMRDALQQLAESGIDPEDWGT